MNTMNGPSGVRVKKSIFLYNAFIEKDKWQCLYLKVCIHILSNNEYMYLSCQHKIILCYNTLRS